METEKYFTLRKSVPFDEVSFGYVSFSLFPPDRLEMAQVGFARDSEGEDINGNCEGEWKANWFVIGRESLLGDPIFVDLALEGLPVFTARHGEGLWRSTIIATTFLGFAEALKIVDSLGHGRRNPVEFDRNPLPESERQGALSMISQCTQTAPAEIWRDCFES